MEKVQKRISQYLMPFSKISFQSQRADICCMFDAFSKLIFLIFKKFTAFLKLLKLTKTIFENVQYVSIGHELSDGGNRILEIILLKE